MLYEPRVPKPCSLSQEIMRESVGKWDNAQICTGDTNGRTKTFAVKGQSLRTALEDSIRSGL